MYRHPSSTRRPAGKLTRAGLLGLAALIWGVTVLAEPTDLAGREIDLPGKVDRVLLGEGRFLVPTSILEGEEAIDRIVGMQGEFKRLDPAGYTRFRAAFPAVDEIPRVGRLNPSSFSVERALSMAPDVAFFGLEGHGPSPGDRPVIERLEQAGVTVVFIDFRHDPLTNTVPSMRLMGEVLGRQEEAEAFISAYQREMARVDDGLAEVETQPDVFLESRVGLREECCETMSNGMLGLLVERAGGNNIATDLLPGSHGLVSLEYLLSHQPDIYIGTAIGSKNDKAHNGHIVLGAGVSEAQARQSLDVTLQRRGIREFEAVKNGRAHAIWHHFYNSPFNVVALQAFAKWLHPEAFRDLEPAETFDRLRARFLPYETTGTYWIKQR
ncbi:ABC transporter substrate-binding protein [Guyparkeria halophila]|uniref:ABC transporter substrate-binding protein n=1 Tax=Guyparkeria halophila TaxID=47960 RepID=A0ABZ0YZ91_9GAMM|nr:ABC transporter substrate-binding protein [Guyparkeria halophila]WQH16684.1 ABC transporter substrate-binding protein [Guyparkeria halophila]